jgi:hypothetical protein
MEAAAASRTAELKKARALSTSTAVRGGQAGKSSTTSRTADFSSKRPQFARRRHHVGVHGSRGNGTAKSRRIGKWSLPQGSSSRQDQMKS